MVASNSSAQQKTQPTTPTTTPTHAETDAQKWNGRHAKARNHGHWRTLTEEDGDPQPSLKTASQFGHVLT